MKNFFLNLFAKNSAFNAQNLLNVEQGGRPTGGQSQPTEDPDAASDQPAPTPEERQEIADSIERGKSDRGDLGTEMASQLAIEYGESEFSGDEEAEGFDFRLSGRLDQVEKIKAGLTASGFKKSFTLDSPKGEKIFQAAVFTPEIQELFDQETSRWHQKLKPVIEQIEAGNTIAEILENVKDSALVFGPRGVLQFLLGVDRLDGLLKKYQLGAETWDSKRREALKGKLRIEVGGSTKAEVVLKKQKKETLKYEIDTTDPQNPMLSLEKGAETIFMGFKLPAGFMVGTVERGDKQLIEVQSFDREERLLIELDTEYGVPTIRSTSIYGENKNQLEASIINTDLVISTEAERQATGKARLAKTFDQVVATLEKDDRVTSVSHNYENGIHALSYISRKSGLIGKPHLLTVDTNAKTMVIDDKKIDIEPDLSRIDEVLQENRKENEAEIAKNKESAKDEGDEGEEPTPFGGNKEILF